MSKKLKELDQKNYTCYFLDDMINIKNLESYRNILIYHIGYVMVKEVSYVTLNSGKPLYLIINKMNGYRV